MAHTKHKAQIQREKPVPVMAATAFEAGTDLPVIPADGGPISGRGARLAFTVWAAGFLFLSAFLVWDLIAALFSR